ncbi:hypothetical protein SAMN05518672_10616 [Chitinophaga sp. CF118]|uniref:hypothetical protein n=1 Tax=Chitinophaga sp. CF118 TaxID=1884367 RepID=UPI0008E74213|nr:hypothetical protein [Chitinophaga sp. CF118]SFE40413.1 hypothetical protein SAMN05518672_10616 [Chitinophaga sp. CF118]
MNSTTRILIILICCLLSFLPVLYAIDTLILNKPVPASKFGNFQEGGFYIRNKAFIVPYMSSEPSLFYFIQLKSLSNPIYFIKCSFNIINNKPDVVYSNIVRKSVVIDSSNVKYLHLKRNFGLLDVFHSNIGVISLDSGSNSELKLSFCNVKYAVIIKNSTNVDLHFYDVNFVDSSVFRVISSSIKNVSFHSADRTKTQYYYFANDTIDNVTFLTNEDSLNSPYTFGGSFKHIYNFRACHINSDFTFFQRDPDAKIVFDRCTFGPDAYLSDMVVDRIDFINCRDLREKVSIGFREHNIQSQLRLVNSDIENIEIVWNNGLRLVFDSSDNRDVIGNTFESLLAKYKFGGKKDSYQRVDLQARTIEQSKIVHLIDKYWWYYSYKKYLVFLWVIGLLILFTFINYCKWNGVQLTYPILFIENCYYNDLNMRLKKVKIVFIYTAFIFFALKIDLDKLKVHNHLGYIVWFFFQYLTGLSCLLFIFNAILHI